jgi:hypothetical protein
MVALQLFSFNWFALKMGCYCSKQVSKGVDGSAFSFISVHSARPTDSFMISPEFVVMSFTTIQLPLISFQRRLSQLIGMVVPHDVTDNPRL